MRWSFTSLARVTMAFGLALGALGALGAGCESTEHLPPRTPGGGIPPFGTGGDGGVGDASGPGDGGALVVTGRVCRILDLRYPTQCQQYPDMSGLTVVESSTGAFAVTTGSGDFALDLTELAGYSSVAVEVGYGDIDFVSSVIWLDLSSGAPSSVVVPLVDAQAWSELQIALAVVLPAGTGSIAVYLRDRGAPLAGGQVVSPDPAYGIYTDNGGIYNWLPEGYTGSAGAALLLGVRPPGGDLTAIDAGGVVIRDVPGIPVIEDAITFLTVDLGY